MKTEREIEYDNAVRNKSDKWVAGCGGKEEDFIYRGTLYLYCYNPARHEWQYINLETDMPEVLVFDQDYIWK